MNAHRTMLKKLAVFMGLIGLAVAALAQGTPAWRPDKPVKMVLGFAAGSGSDTVARLIAPRLATVLGQPVVVENRAGAGGVIAADFVAKAPGDGSTWLFVASAHATTAAMRRSLPYQPVQDFAWVSTITTYPLVVAVAPGSPYRSFEDLLRGAKAKGASFSSVGPGTAHHLVGEWINTAAGVEMLHVPFKGGATAATEVIAGRVDAMIDTMTFVLPMVQQGQLRPLAVTAAAPVPSMASVPPVARSVPGVVYESWLGLALPATVKPELVASANAAMRQVLADPTLQQRLTDLGGQPAPSSPEAFRNRVESDIAKFLGVVESRKIPRE